MAARPKGHLSGCVSRKGGNRTWVDVIVTARDPETGHQPYPHPPKTGHSCCDKTEVGGVSAPAAGKAQRGGAAGKLGDGRNDLSPLRPCPASPLAGFAGSSLNEGWRGLWSQRPQRPRGAMASVAAPGLAGGPRATPGCPARRAQPGPPTASRSGLVGEEGPRPLAPAPAGGHAGRWQTDRWAEQVPESEARACVGGPEPGAGTAPSVPSPSLPRGLTRPLSALSLPAAAGGHRRALGPRTLGAAPAHSVA